MRENHQLTPKMEENFEYFSNHICKGSRSMFARHAAWYIVNKVVKHNFKNNIDYGSQM